MTPCLSPEEVIDLVDGVLPAARAAHVEGCADCRATAARIREALAFAAAPAIPEPPEFFWASVNARVRSAVAEGSPLGWRAWLRWDVVVPLAGLALVVVALASAIDAVSPGDGRPRDPAPAATTDADAVSPERPAGTDTTGSAAGDDALVLMMDLADTLPEGGWDELGVTRLPDLDVAAAALSADEQRALADLLHAAVERPKS